MLHQDGLPELACCLITRDLCSALHYLHSQVFKMLCYRHLQFHFPGSGPSFPSVFPYSHIWHWSCCIIGSQVKFWYSLGNEIPNLPGTALHCTPLVRAGPTYTTSLSMGWLATSPGLLLKYCSKTYLATMKPVTSTALQWPFAKWPTALCHSARCLPLWCSWRSCEVLPPSLWMLQPWEILLHLRSSLNYQVNNKCTVHCPIVHPSSYLSKGSQATQQIPVWVTVLDLAATQCWAETQYITQGSSLPNSMIWSPFVLSLSLTPGPLPLSC